MACGRPVIVSAWGGHLSTVDDTVGILADVSSRAVLVRGHDRGRPQRTVDEMYWTATVPRPQRGVSLTI